LQKRSDFGARKDSDTKPVVCEVSKGEKGKKGITEPPLGKGPLEGWEKETIPTSGPKGRCRNRRRAYQKRLKKNSYIKLIKKSTSDASLAWKPSLCSPEGNMLCVRALGVYHRILSKKQRDRFM